MFLKTSIVLKNSYFKIFKKVMGSSKVLKINSIENFRLYGIYIH